MFAGVGDRELGCIVHCAELQPVTEGTEHQPTNSLQCRGRNYQPFCTDVEGRVAFVIVTVQYTEACSGLRLFSSHTVTTCTPWTKKNVAVHLTS